MQYDVNDQTIFKSSLPAACSYMPRRNFGYFTSCFSHPRSNYASATGMYGFSLST